MLLMRYLLPLLTGLTLLNTCGSQMNVCQGSVNNQRSVNQTATFAWVGDESTQEVFVAGDFTGWAVITLLLDTFHA